MTSHLAEQFEKTNLDELMKEANDAGKEKEAKGKQKSVQEALEAGSRPPPGRTDQGFYDKVCAAQEKGGAAAPFDQMEAARKRVYTRAQLERAKRELKRCQNMGRLLEHIEIMMNDPIAEQREQFLVELDRAMKAAPGLAAYLVQLGGRRRRRSRRRRSRRRRRRRRSRRRSRRRRRRSRRRRRR